VDSSYLFHTTLLQQMHAGLWQAGDRLPTEREFSEQHQISRSTVRKVLADLKTQGLIAQKVGSGTYVTEKAADLLNQGASAHASAAAAERHTSPAELMQARMALEPAIIEW